MITDHNMAWVRKRKYYSWTELHNLAESAGVLRANNDATQLPTITVQTLSGIALATAENFDGWFPCPQDLNPAFPVGLRARWTANVTTPALATLVTLTALLNAIADRGLIAVATSALNTVLGSQVYAVTASVVSGLFAYSTRGIKNSIGLTREQIEAGAWLAVRLTPSAYTNIVAGQFFLLGLEIDYVPIKLIGAGSELDAPLSSNF